jgi:hypothetical protein
LGSISLLASNPETQATISASSTEATTLLSSIDDIQRSFDGDQNGFPWAPRLRLVARLAPEGRNRIFADNSNEM